MDLGERASFEDCGNEGVGGVVAEVYKEGYGRVYGSGSSLRSSTEGVAESGGYCSGGQCTGGSWKRNVYVSADGTIGFGVWACSGFWRDYLWSSSRFGEVVMFPKTDLSEGLTGESSSIVVLLVCWIEQN